MSERLAWGKFAWSDWENDPALALVSMAAQGLWMRLLCIAAKEGGYVLIGGEKPTEAKLAKLVRASVSEVTEWLSELETERVFSRTADGTIYSRRMVRDAKASRRNRENGSKGGNPSLRKHDDIPPSDNPPTQPPTQPPAQPHDEKGVKAEEKREEKKEPNGSVAANRSDDLFGLAWKAYPDVGRRRSSAAKARPAWRKAAKAAGGEARLLSAVERYAASDDAHRDGGHYVPGFHRWLNDAKWEHDLPTDAPLLDLASKPDPWAKRIADYTGPNRYWNRYDWGEPPGKPGCTLPAELQREHGYEPAPPLLAARGAA